MYIIYLYISIHTHTNTNTHTLHIWVFINRQSSHPQNAYMHEIKRIQGTDLCDEVVGCARVFLKL